MTEEELTEIETDMAWFGGEPFSIDRALQDVSMLKANMRRLIAEVRRLKGTPC